MSKYCSGTFVTLSLVMVFSNCFYALAAPFLPEVFVEDDVATEYIGIIFAAFSVASMIFSPHVAKMIDCFGQTNLITTGMVLMGLATTFFGFVEEAKSTSSIVIGAVCLRFIQGIASALLNIATYSFASLTWPKEAEEVIQNLEAISGVGLIMGPIIGSIFFTFLGFKETFIVLGCFLFPVALVMHFFLRKKQAALGGEHDDEFTDADAINEGEGQILNSEPKEVARIDTDSSEHDSVEEITNWTLLKNRRLVFACLCGALAFFTDTQLEPIFELKLEEFEMSIFQVGLMFTIIPLTYIPSMLAVQYLPKRIDLRLTLVTSAFLLGCFTFFNGPSALFGMPNKLGLIMTGQAFSGIFIACVTVPALPEMIHAAKCKPEQQHHVNTLCSGLFNASVGLGNILGPVISGELYALVGFEWTEDIVALTCITFSILYLFFGTGLTGFKETCAAKSQVKEGQLLDKEEEEGAGSPKVESK